ncbi:MAG: hypothetical protein JWM14_2211 [Chitinophagaceae bacterium]|nr:hypothetical protein [Chitinophagaceae bacterium]
MYTTLLFAHSIIRWFVLISLVYTIYRSYIGHSAKRSFSKTDDAVRHWTATIAHVQLVVGFTLYIQSPIVKYFWASPKETTASLNGSFFGWMHILCMLIAIVVITIGSAKAKRKSTDVDKFKTLLIWFSFALFIILMAIPWPFLPFANRPYIRPF